MTQLSTALATLPQPMAILRSIRDEHGSVADFRWTFVNDAAAAAIPSTPGLVGTRLLELVPDLPRGLFDAYVRVVETGEPVTIEQIGYDATWGRDPTDREAVVSVRATKVDDGLALSWTVVDEPDAPGPGETPAESASDEPAVTEALQSRPSLPASRSAASARPTRR